MAVALLASAIAWQLAGRDEARSFAGEPIRLDGVVPARAGITLPPGTSIGAGLEVAEGSYLLGGALPYLYSSMHGGDPIEDDGFEAHLLVTEPLRDVVDRYRAQAVAAGFEMSPVWCVEREGVVACHTQCQESCGFPSGYEHGRTLVIGGEQGAVARRGPRSTIPPPVSHLRIEHRSIGDPPFPTEAAVAPAPLTTTRGAVPADWPPLPDVDDPIYSFNDFEVAPGTILLAHGLGSSDGVTRAIFEVVDDSDSVIEQITRQPRYPADDVRRETFERDGERIDFVAWSDGQGQSLEVHHLAAGPTLLVLVSTVTD